MWGNLDGIFWIGENLLCHNCGTEKILRPLKEARSAKKRMLRIGLHDGEEGDGGSDDNDDSNDQKVGVQPNSGQNM